MKTISDWGFDNDSVVINLAMIKIGDKALELEELNKLQAEQIKELQKLMSDWADVLIPKNASPAEKEWLKRKHEH